MKKRWFGKKVVSVILSAALATGGWMMPVSAGAAELTDGLLLHYDFSADSVEGTTVTDLSGNDRNGTIYGAAVQEGILKLAGSADYVEMPAMDWSGYDAITISMDLKPEQEYSNLFAYNFGRNDVAAANAQSGYMFLNPSRPNERTARFALTQTNYEQETEVQASRSVPINTWNHCVVTVEGNTAKIYLDGKPDGTAQLTMKPSDLGKTEYNWIAKSPYSGDPNFKGEVSDFRIYDRALTESEVSELYEYVSNERKKATMGSDFRDDVDSIFIPNENDIRGNITLPSECANGSTVTWTSSDESVISTKETDVTSETAKKYDAYDKVPAGVVTRQAEDKQVHLTAQITDASGENTVKKEFDVTVKAAVDPKTDADYAGYLYAYFRGDADTTHYQQTYFAISRDGLNWKDLNAGEPVLTSSMGTRGLRDHFLIRSPEGDRFFLIATDLNVGVSGGNWTKYAQQGSKSIMVWESEDLVHWSDQRMVQVVNNDMGCAWAPEAMYDENTGEYVVYLSVDTTAISGVKDKKVIYYVKTRDFWHFTEPQIFIGNNDSSDATSYLDTTMLKAGDSYYRITKRENVSPTWVFMEKSDAILGDYTEISSNIGSSTAKGERDFEGVEGPAIFKFNHEDKWCLMLDGYNGANSGVGWFPSTITDLDGGQFTRLTEGFQMPSGPKHGVMIPVTETEYQDLMKEWSSEADLTPGTAPEEQDIYGYVKAYSSGTNETDGSVHLAIREKGQEEWTALNSDSGILFPRLDDTVAQHSLYFTDVTLARLEDNSFAVMAQTNKDNGLSYYYLTDDLVTYADQKIATTESLAVLSGTQEIPLTEEEYKALQAKYGTVVNDGVEPVGDVTIQAGEINQLPKTVTEHYSDGSTAEFPVEWDSATYNEYSAGTYTVTGTVKQTRYSNPLIEERADPYIVLGDDGYYYFTASYPAYGNVNNGYDRVALRRAKTIEDLKDAEEVTIWGPGRSDYSVLGKTPKHVWAPEMHFVDGQWYIYFASGYQGGEWNIRPQVLQCAKGANPMEPDSWTFLGQMKGNLYESMSLDMTEFEHNGKEYVVWAHLNTPEEKDSSLYIAELENPWTIKGDPVLITRPEFGWERAGAKKENASGTHVNEGPTILKKDGKIFLAYSAADTADTYCIGLLTADEDADLLNKKSWKKNQYPLLCTADVPGEIGPGHNSFTVDENGNAIFVYHARPISHASQQCGHYNSNGLYDPCRHARVKRVHWAADGTPILKMVYDDELKEEYKTVTMTLKVEGEFDEDQAMAKAVEELTVPYVLAQGAELPQSWPGGIRLSWTADQEQVLDGTAVAGTGSKPISATLTAELSGPTRTEQKEFQVVVLPGDVSEVLSYTRSGSNAVTDSMHLGLKTKGDTTFQALNYNEGVLFASADYEENTYNGVTKAMNSPYLFRMTDGSFGVVAAPLTIAAARGTSAFDTNRNGTVQFYHGTDLLSWEKQQYIELDPQGKRVCNPYVTFDPFRKVYQIFWKDPDGNAYVNETADFEEIGEPKQTDAYELERVSCAIPDARTVNVVSVTEEEAKRLKDKLLPLENTGIETPEPIEMQRNSTIRFDDLPDVKATYSDGSTANLNVEWSREDFNAINFKRAGEYVINGTVTPKKYAKTFLADRADPCVLKDGDTYYFIATTDDGGQHVIYLRRSDTLEGLAKAEDHTLVSSSGLLWAPEIHSINGTLNIFYATGGAWNQVQSHVITLKEGEDPTQASSWTQAARIRRPDGDYLYTRGITLDMTYITLGDKSYYVWAQRQIGGVGGASGTGSSDLYIAQVDPDDLTQVVTEPKLLTNVEYGWDRLNTEVDEGPFAVKHDGKLYLTFSGSATDSTYCIGMMSIPTDADPLVIDNWKKTGYPILTAAVSEPGPGHNSFTVDEKGNNVLVFHYGTGGSHRTTSLRTVHWAADGSPILSMLPEDEVAEKYKEVQLTVKVVNKEGEDHTFDAPKIEPADSFGTANGQWEQQSPYGNALDGEIDTYFDGQKGGYVGIDANGTYYLEGYRIVAREKYASRLEGALIQGSNDKDTWVTLDTLNGVKDYPDATIGYTDCAEPYRYFRLVDGGAGSCNVAEVEFYGYPFKLPGDIDEDGSLDASDALLALKAANRSIQLSEREAMIADMNQDGNVTLSDALEILRRSVMTNPELETLVIHNLDDVRGNLTLPARTEYGTRIEWSSSDEDVITSKATGENKEIPAGVVHRPKDGDREVTLTARIVQNGISVSKRFTAVVRKDPGITEDDYEGYLFAYFTDNTVAGEKIYFGSSSDGYNFQALNGGEPVLESTLGEQGLRDPFLMRSPEGDKFYLIATDLSIGRNGNWTRAQQSGSQSIMVWESNDLVHWSDQRMIELSASLEAGCTWAPEFIYDDTTGEYLVFWASRIKADSYGKQRIYYSRTRDFYTFTEPELYIERNVDVIDATIVKYKGKYYRLSKDETDKNIIMEVGDSLLGEFKTVSASVLNAQKGVEGPELYRINGTDQWCAILDNYGGGGYYPLLTEDLAGGTFRVLGSQEYSYPKARHGSVISLTAEELQAVKKAYPDPGEAYEQMTKITPAETFGSANGEWEQKSPYTNALDGKPDTYFDGQSDSYVGIDAGDEVVLKGFRLIGRSGYTDRANGNQLQGSNDKQRWETIDTFDGSTYPNYTNRFYPDNQKSYRYYRYAAGTSQYCNVAEVEFYTE